MAKLGFVITVMMAPQFIAVEAYLFMASYISAESLSAFFILRNVFIFLREIPIAYQWVCVSLTGICVGNGRVEQAKRYYLSIQFTAAVITIVEIALLLAPKQSLQGIFTDKPDII